MPLEKFFLYDNEGDDVDYDYDTLNGEPANPPAIDGRYFLGLVKNEYKVLNLLVLNLNVG